MSLLAMRLWPPNRPWFSIIVLKLSNVWLRRQDLRFQFSLQEFVSCGVIFMT